MATAVSFVAIAVAMWNRAQMQVSVQVVDSCTVGSAAGATSSGAACDAPGGRPAADTPKSPLSGGHPPIAREETSHDGVTTVVF